jgi:hypothetical protein
LSRIIVGVGLTVVATLCITHGAFAEGPSATNSDPTDPEKEALQRRVDTLTLQKEIAELEKQILEARFPTANVTVPEGKTSLSGDVSIEVALLSYAALRRCVWTIAEAVIPEAGRGAASRDTAVVITHNLQYRSRVNTYQGALESLKELRDYYQTIVDEMEKVKKMATDPDAEKLSVRGTEVKAASVAFASIAATAFIATSVAKSIFEFTSLFASDLAIQGVEVKLDRRGLAAQISKTLQGARTVYYDAITYTPVQGSELQAVLESIVTLRRETLRFLVSYDETKPRQKQIKELIGQLNTMTNEVMKSLNQIESTSGVNPRGALLSQEKLNQVLERESTSVLFVDVFDGGGNNLTTSNLLRKIFSGSNLRHSGGAIVGYVLLSGDGTILDADTIGRYVGYESHEYIQDRFSGTEVAEP